MDGRKGEERNGCPFCSFFEQYREAEAHVLNAKREILLAIRVIIDREIEATGRAMDRKGKRKKAEKVEID
jgi:hypothetical protein